MKSQIFSSTFCAGQTRAVTSAPLLVGDAAPVSVLLSHAPPVSIPLSLHASHCSVSLKEVEGSKPDSLFDVCGHALEFLIYTCILLHSCRHMQSCHTSQRPTGSLGFQYLVQSLPVVELVRLRSFSRAQTCRNLLRYQALLERVSLRTKLKNVRSFVRRPSPNPSISQSPGPTGRISNLYL